MSKMSAPDEQSERQAFLEQHTHTKTLTRCALNLRHNVTVESTIAALEGRVLNHFTKTQHPLSYLRRNSYEQACA